MSQDVDPQLKARIDQAIDSWYPVGLQPTGPEMDELKARVALVVRKQVKEAEDEADRLRDGLDQIWRENFEWAQNIDYRGFAERIGNQILNVRQGFPVNGKKKREQG